MTAGRERWPRLRVCFVALAGLAPLHGERHRARGGEPQAVDPLTFVETSSYGERAIDAVGRVLGIDVICHGSDRPYATSRLPDLGVAALHAVRVSNPARLLPRPGDRMTLSHPLAVAGRVLSPPELAALAADVAAQQALWQPRLDPRATVRTYASLHRDPELELWAIAWLPENDTGWHDHDSSSGAVHVVEGALEEHVLRLGGPERRVVHAPGATFSFGPDHIHRVTCSGARAVSIHAYSPRALAAGPVRGRRGRRAAPPHGVLRRRAAPARRAAARRGLTATRRRGRARPASMIATVRAPSPRAAARTRPRSRRGRSGG